jgi:hypothetical protein
MVTSGAAPGNAKAVKEQATALARLFQQEFKARRGSLVQRQRVDISSGRPDPGAKKAVLRMFSLC